MPFLIGTDEAGYGPSLGPLVVSASLWWVEDGIAAADLYQRLKGVVGRTASSRGEVPRLHVADSKELYSPAQGLQALERGVLGALALVDRLPADWHDVWRLLGPGSLHCLGTMPWHEGYELTLPLAADQMDLEKLLPKLRRGFDKAGVRLMALESRAMFPDEFNRTNLALGNKSETLSTVTLQLVAQMLQRCEGDDVFIICDKHGGRNFYGRLLQQQFPDPLVEVHGETNAESIYRWGSPGQRVEIRFRAKGEALMPAALASMASKYLRELSMRAFNDFWRRHIPDLTPTAGYYRDAQRFRAQVGALQTSLGIADHIMWRER